MMETCVEYDFPEGAAPEMPEKRCYTVEELQIILEVSRPTVYNLIRQKQFRAFQVAGGKWRVSKKSFDEWLDARC